MTDTIELVKRIRKPKAAWNDEAVLSLLNEVKVQNPFSKSHKEKGPTWQNIAEKINVGNGVKGEHCQAKVKSLMNTFDKSKYQHLKETGITGNDDGKSHDLLQAKNKAIADVIELYQNAQVNKEKRIEFEKKQSRITRCIERECLKAFKE